ncbi:hypothetical protein KP509_1Z326500 [Ceratopteris richardii]|nr:hypothetical protein KP509_1Z326500 [Ceratopteris richardii]
MVSLMDCVDCSEFIQSRTPNHPQVVTLQAFIRGALVRKMKREMLLQREKKIYNLVTRAQAMWKGWRVRKHRFLETLHAERPQDIATIRIQAVWRGFSSRKKFKMLLQKEKEMYNLVTRAQAIWKGWRTRKHGLLERLRAERRLREIATSRIQAIWRGFRTRQRFKMAMLSSRYDEDDEGDYEYATVDEIDEKLWFDDYLKIYPDNSGNLREDKRDIQQECSLDISEEMSKVLTARGKVHFEKDAENIPYNMNSSSFFITRNCTGKSCADGPILSCNSNVPLEDEACTSSQDFIKANEAIDVKQLPCDTTRTAVIEIARDW